MFRTDVQNNRWGHEQVDVAIVGGGLSGMATALRLQAAGRSTVIFEAHGHAGGCAGYWRHKGFSFDVGATTLVDFEPGGVGAELLDAVGVPGIVGERLAGYEAWLPDRRVTLHRDQAEWSRERLRKFGDDRGHREFWALLDRLSQAFWSASRNGAKLPIRNVADLAGTVKALDPKDLPLARYLNTTLGQLLREHGCDRDRALKALLGMLVEDTVHTTVDSAPAINAALGVTIRGAGLSRHYGGMHGFWRTLVKIYRELGGVLRTGTTVVRVDGDFTVTTTRGVTTARQVVMAVPAPAVARICAGLPVERRLRRYLRRDENALGGAAVVFLGVPESEVYGQPLTHHQLLQDYGEPFGDGNNMFVSVSAAGDTLSAPAGHRAVMISTHTDLASWRDGDYQQRKKEIGERLIGYARRVYPNLAAHPIVEAVGTPRTYERFGLRPGGAVGGVKQTLRNTNQYAIPHDLGGRGLWMVGDSTWPGLGTVACVIGSRIVADGIQKECRQWTFRRSPR